MIARGGRQLRARAAWTGAITPRSCARRTTTSTRREIKPYFQLDKMIEAAFETAHRLFGLNFKPVNVPLYHPDARAWDVTDAAGKHVGLFIGDYFARGSKHSGAWMTRCAISRSCRGDIRPIILNVCNFSKPAPGEPALLVVRRRAHACSTNSATACTACCRTSPIRCSPARRCRAISSNCRRSFTSTGWKCRRFCRSTRCTPRPARRCRRRCSTSVLATRTFNQGFATVEYTSCALVDLDIHALPDAGASRRHQLRARRGCKAIDMPAEIVMRHRLPHFQHSVLRRRLRRGLLLVHVVGSARRRRLRGLRRKPAMPSIRRRPKRLHDFIYIAGNLRDPGEAYKAFRGQSAVRSMRC